MVGPPYNGAEGQRIPNALVQTGQRVSGRTVVGKSRTNLITNGTFETNANGWAAPSGFAGTHTRSTSYAAVGSASLQVENTSGGADDLGTRWDTQIAVEPGKVYRFRVAVARNATIPSDQQILVGLQLFDETGTFIDTHGVLTTLLAANTFEYVDYPYAVPSTVRFVRPVVRTAPGDTAVNTAIIRVDDASFTLAQGGQFDGAIVGDVATRSLVVGAQVLESLDRGSPAPFSINGRAAIDDGAPVLGPGGIPLTQLIGVGNTIAGSTPPAVQDSHHPYFMQAGYNQVTLAGASGAYITFPVEFPNGLLSVIITPMLHVAISALRSRLSHWVGSASDRTRIHVLAHDPGMVADTYKDFSTTTDGDHAHDITSDSEPDHDHTGNTDSSSGHIHPIFADGARNHDHGGTTSTDGAHGGHILSTSIATATAEVPAGWYSGDVGYCWVAYGW